MNISHDGVTVYFKTEPQELFEAEKSGAKPNTVRIVDNDEYEMLNTHPPKKIGIRYQEEIFIRPLTNLHFAKLFGKVIVIFSWVHEKFENTLQGPHSASTTPGDHNLSPVSCICKRGDPCHEKFHAITISTQTLAILQDLAHGQSMDSAIRLLHDAYLNRKTSTWRPRHD